MAEVRWTPLRKAQLVGIVARGIASRAEVLALHEISEEEFSAWEGETSLSGLRTGQARPKPLGIEARTERAAPWKSAQAPSSLPELADWFASQVEHLRKLAETYVAEARLRMRDGDRAWALSLVDLSQTMTVQARSYEHAANLCAELGQAPR